MWVVSKKVPLRYNLGSSMLNHTGVDVLIKGGANKVTRWVYGDCVPFTMSRLEV